MSQIKKPLETRRASGLIEIRALDNDAQTVELSFSSESPVERQFGAEILDHAPGSVRIGRLNGAAPLLVNHNPDDQVGVVESAR
ncbi:MAG: phage major capsid protein, partial [Gammaproteobacteria bacterium]|nr:phage major capsid protein [Gammaproteobacteria bacterium]